MSDRIVRARWWAIVALLLGIQADVSTLHHPADSHETYTALSIVAWGVVAFNVWRRA